MYLRRMQMCRKPTKRSQYQIDNMCGRSLHSSCSAHKCRRRRRRSWFKRNWNKFLETEGIRASAIDCQTVTCTSGLALASSLSSRPVPIPFHSSNTVSSSCSLCCFLSRFFTLCLLLGCGCPDACLKTDTVASMLGVLPIIVECSATQAFEDSGHIDSNRAI